MAAFAVALLTTLTLTGCPDGYRAEGNCGGSFSSWSCSEVLFFAEYNLHGKEPVLSAQNAFSAAFAGVELGQSSSSVEVGSSAGHATIKLWLSDGTMVVNAFPWVRSGDLIVAQNPGAIDNWLSPYLNNIVDAEVNLGSLSGTGAAGANTVVAEAVYDNSVLAGTSYSWYNNCDPSDPSGQCQIP